MTQLKPSFSTGLACVALGVALAIAACSTSMVKAH